MFYCDKCAKDSNWPIWGIEEMKSWGECEICSKVKACSDFKEPVTKEGYVQIYPVNPNKFPECREFAAKKGKYKILGIDLKRTWGDKKTIFVPAFLTETYTSLIKAKERLLTLKADYSKQKSKKSDRIALLFAHDGVYNSIKGFVKFNQRKLSYE